MPKRWSALPRSTPPPALSSFRWPISRPWRAPFASELRRLRRRATVAAAIIRETTMRSQCVVEFGRPLQEMETEKPVPQGTEVLLKVNHAAVCLSVLHIHDGFSALVGATKLPMASIKLPHTLG